MLGLVYGGLAIFSHRGVLTIGDRGDRISALQAHIETYKTNLSFYREMNGHFPATTQGLAALVSKPEGDPQLQNWRQIMREQIVDPWGRPYVYQHPGTHNPDLYDLFSVERDGKAGTSDDAGNW